MTAAEWIAKRRATLGLLSAYQHLRRMAGDLTAVVAVGSLGIRGSDITAAEDDARESLPRALDALEAVLEAEPMPNRLDMQPPDRDYAEGHNDALRLVARELTTALEAS